MGYSPEGRKQSDTTEVTLHSHFPSRILGSCSWALSSWGQRGLLFAAVHRFLTVVFGVKKLDKQVKEKGKISLEIPSHYQSRQSLSSMHMCTHTHTHTHTQACMLIFFPRSQKQKHWGIFENGSGTISMRWCLKIIFSFCSDNCEITIAIYVGEFICYHIHVHLCVHVFYQIQNL